MNNNSSSTKLSDAAQKAKVDAAAQKAKELFTKSYGKFKGAVGESGLIIVLIIIFVLVFIIVIIYISFKIKSSKLEGKRAVTLPIRLNNMTSPYEISGSLLPAPAIGLEYSYAMWIYVEDFDQSGGRAPKLIFYRSATPGLSIANPIVMMDAINSKMYIVIKSNTSKLESNDLQSVLDNNCFLKSGSTCGPGTNTHMVLTIDYVPIQRWVHVAFSIDNKIITVFLDGEIYMVKSVDEFRASMQLTSLITDKTSGTLFVGPSAGIGQSINGYMSRLEFFNYAMSFNEVRDIYSQGPYKKSFLSYLGVSNYGFRAPVYRLDEVTKNTEKA
jgi:hypothetical protein